MPSFDAGKAPRRSASSLADMPTHSDSGPPPRRWSFLDPVDTAALTTVHVLEGRLPVILVAHDSDDGMWQFLCGTSRESKDARIIGLGEMLEIDPSLAEIADLPVGWTARRNAPGQKWHRQPRATDE